MASPNKQRLWINLALLLSILLLFVLVIKSNKHDETVNHKTLYDVSIGDEAKEIVVHAEGLKDVVLKEVDGVWKVVQPSIFVADKRKIQHLLTLLAENADKQFDTTGIDLSQYGLDNNTLSVSFNGVVIVFGDYNPITQQRYLLKGNTMYLMDETVSGLMQMGEEGFKPSVSPKLSPADVK